MELVSNNPYRILGVFSDASLKEITANKTKLIRYASVGKSVSCDADKDDILPPIGRTPENLEKAFADLSLSQDKLRHALFWFAKGDTTSDGESWSTLVNTGVLALVNGNWGKAINCLTKVIHTTSYRTAMVKAICGDTFQMEESELATMFIDGLKEERPASDLYPLFVANGFDALDAGYLKESMTNEPTEKLNAEINKAQAVKDDGAAIYKAGSTLLDNAKPLLEQLERLIGTDSVEYKLLADKCANTVLQCCIDSFNAFQKELEDNNGAENFREYAPKIKALIHAIGTFKISETVKDRIASNMKTITEIVEDLDSYIINNSNTCFYCEKNEADPSAKHTFMMYLVTGRDHVFNKRTVYFKQLELSVNRCEQCKRIHQKYKRLITTIILLCILVSVIISCAIAKDTAVGLLFGGIPGGVVALITCLILKSQMKKKFHVKMLTDTKGHPTVKRLKNEGWTSHKPSA